MPNQDRLRIDHQLVPTWSGRTFRCNGFTAFVMGKPEPYNISTAEKMVGKKSSPETYQASISPNSTG